MVFSTAFVPYIYDTLRGGTRPDRVCWLIWSVLAMMSGASNLYEGAEASMWFVGVQVTGTLVVFTLSVWRGHGAFLSRGNATILAVATLGVVSWALTDTAVYVLAISISVSALGAGATMWKAYHSPSSETMSAWTFCCWPILCIYWCFTSGFWWPS